MAWANNYDVIYPDGSTQKVPVLDDAIKTLAKANQERLNVCLYFPLTGTQVSDANAGKIRKLLFKAATTKSTLVAGEFEIYPKSVGGKTELVLQNEDGTEKQLTSGGKLLITSAELLGILANNTYLTAKDVPGTGTVNLIKAGRNEADDADVAILPDAARLATNAAPAEDTGIPNKKYVDDTPHTGGIVQVVNTQTGAYSSGTTIIPYDDTIPQSHEGDQYMSLAITPKSATNKLKIEVIANVTNSNAGVWLCVALFKDTDSDALACSSAYMSAGGGVPQKFTHYMIAGTTSEITFKVRAGGQGGGTYFNGFTARKYGGVLASSITITEIKV
jgi:hypothetical protein